MFLNKLNLYLTQNVCISDYNHSILRSSNRDIQSSRISQKANEISIVWPHTRNNNVVFLSPLIAIYRGDFNLFVIIWIVLKNSTPFMKIIYYVEPLALVRCNYSYLVCLNPCSIELKENFINSDRLISIQKWCSWCWNFLLSMHVEK